METFRVTSASAHDIFSQHLQTFYPTGGLAIWPVSHTLSDKYCQSIWDWRKRGNSYLIVLLCIVLIMIYKLTIIIIALVVVVVVHGMNHHEPCRQDLALTVSIEGSIAALWVEVQYDKDNPGQEVYSYWKSCHVIALCAVLARVQIMRVETFELISMWSSVCCYWLRL